MLERYTFLATCAATLTVLFARSLLAVELPYTGSDIRLWLEAVGDLRLDTVDPPDRVIGWSDQIGFGARPSLRTASVSAAIDRPG